MKNEKVSDETMSPEPLPEEAVAATAGTGRRNRRPIMDSRKPLTAGELEIDCGAFGKIRRASPPAKGDFAIKDGRLTLLGCIQRGLVTLSREELLPFLDAMDAQDAQIQTLNERIIELDLEAMEKCRRVDSLLTPPPDAAVREAVERCEAHIRAHTGHVYSLGEAIRTLLRAVQSPRLTEEQVEAVKNINRKTESRQCICGNGYLCARCEIPGELRAAFPDLFTGEVCRGE